MTFRIEGLDQVVKDSDREFAEAMTCSDVHHLRGLIGSMNGRIRTLVEVLRDVSVSRKEEIR
jgi:hypothetical protein